MKHKNRALFALFFAFSLLGANDIYTLSFDTQDKNCTLTKNSEPIELFDPRFEKKRPKSPYTCYAIQKEQYVDCKRVDFKNTSAQMLSFGQYDYTNLIIAFHNPHESVASSLTIECTKDLPKKDKNPQ